MSRQKVKPKPKVKYKVNAKALTLIKRADIATLAQQKEEMVMQKKVSDLCVRGLSFEEIAEQLDISTSEALRISKEVLARWGTKELNFNANEMVLIELRRLDSMTNAIMKRAFPHPIISDETGLPVLDGAGNPVMTEADLPAMNLLLQVMDRRAKLVGLDAADKREQAKVEMMVRKYIGGAPDEL